MTWVVYTFNDEEGLPFYVGSGSEARPSQHFRNKKTNKFCAEKFASIAQPVLDIVSRHETADEAMAAERSLIASLLPDGRLTNTYMMDKGPPINVRLTDEERDALAAAADGKSLALSAMVRMIVAEWLRKHGWLKRAKR